MLEKNLRITITKSFLISLIFIFLITTVCAFDMSQVSAADMNESLDEVEFDIGVEDKLGNSRDVDVLKGDSLDTHTFNDIREMIEKSKSGDTIYLEGNYVAGSSNNQITIDKKLTITSKTGATLDGENKSSIFFIPSTGKGTSLSNIKFINGLGEFGGAIKIKSDNILISNCDFEHNYVSMKGGAVYSSGLNVIIDGCRFNYNKADSEAGGVYSKFNNISDEGFVVKNSNFTYNTGYKNSGALTALSNNSKIINCIFDHNQAKCDEKCFGGAIQIGLDTDVSYGNVYGCIFTNNAAITTSPDFLSHGGAGCVRNGSSYFNCIFINNTADIGGALTYHASGQIENCTFLNNTARDYGGAITIMLLHDEMNLNISDCIFKYNEAPYGGAIKLEGMNINIENSTFEANHASIDGAAVNIEAFNVNIRNTRFNKNMAENDGGAVFIISENTHIADSSFIANEAIPDSNNLIDGLGGAIYVNSTQAFIENNVFRYNTARNGSAIYYDKYGKNLKLKNNTLFENQAWVYALPIFAEDIYYGENEEIKAIIHGGNNIADYDNLAVSNAIYNAANNENIEVDGETPVSGATMSGELYQDDREYNIAILLTVEHEDGTVVYNNSLNSSYLGEVFANLDDLKPGKYNVTAKHFVDTYYKPIINTTSFRVIPKVDVEVKKSVSSTYNYGDVIVWTLDIKNNGPNDATGVYLTDILPEGLVLIKDLKNYTPSTGRLDIGVLNAGESVSINITTLVNKTGIITNKVNVTSNETDIDLENNYDEETIDVEQACDLEVVKNVDVANPNYHDVVVWTITVLNKGPDIAHEVVVRDLLPEGLEFIDSSADYDEINGIWDIGTLNLNQKVTLSITTRVTKTGIIENNASVKGREYDYDLSNNNDSQIIAVNPSCDLAIIKLANATELDYGEYVKWTLIISNNGPDNATGVKIKELLPDSLILINHTCDVDMADGYFNIGNLNVGDKLTFDIVCKTNKTGNITNIVNITGNEYDYNLENNEDNKTVVVNPATDLGVMKLVNESEPNYGDHVIWTINVYNNGPDIAHEVVVYDLFEKSLIWVSDDSDGAYDHDLGQWDVGTLAVGEIKTLSIESIVNQTGLVENLVSVSGKEFDYDLTNNQDVEVIFVNESADLEIIKSVNSNEINYGDLVKWTLIASNNGPSNATGVLVEDILPEGLILVNYTSTKGIYDDGKWRVCCLENGASETLEIICKVNKTGEISNIAIISGNEHDPILTNNQDEESVFVPKAADVAVIKDVNDTQPLFASQILWTITVLNNGPDDATEVKVFDELPEGLKSISCNASKGSYWDGVWDIGNLANGESQHLNISCIVEDLSEIINIAQVISDEYDWNMSNNNDSEIINPNPICNLAIDKTVSSTTANYGGTVKWILKVTNNGPNDATGVVVEDALPFGFELLKSSGDYDGYCWDVGNLANGESKTLELICKVEITGQHINYAEVYGNEYDPDVSDNLDEEEISIASASDLAITKAVSKKNYLVGDLIKYVIEVVNNGPDDASNVRVTEILDEFVKIRSFKTTLGEFDSKNDLWTIDYLENGQKAVLYLEVEAMAKGIVKNEVHVTSDNYDWDLSNNNDSVKVTVTEVVKNPEFKNLPFKNSDNKTLVDLKRESLQKHITANPFTILLISIMFSIIFCPAIISKKC